MEIIYSELRVSNLILWEPMHGESIRSGQSLPYIDQIWWDPGLNSSAGIKTCMKDHIMWQSFVAWGDSTWWWWIYRRVWLLQPRLSSQKSVQIYSEWKPRMFTIDWPLIMEVGWSCQRHMLQKQYICDGPMFYCFNIWMLWLEKLHHGNTFPAVKFLLSPLGPYLISGPKKGGLLESGAL